MVTGAGGGEGAGRAAPSRVDTPSAVATVEKYRVYGSIANFVGIALLIAATWIPLKAVEPMVEALAGKDTNVSATITISIALSITLAITLGGAYLKIRNQSQELRRLRARITDLEKGVPGAPEPKSDKPRSAGRRRGKTSKQGGSTG